MPVASKKKMPDEDSSSGGEYNEEEEDLVDLNSDDNDNSQEEQDDDDDIEDEDDNENNENEMDKDVLQFLDREADDHSEFDTTGYDTTNEMEETFDNESLSKIADAASELNKELGGKRRKTSRKFNNNAAAAAPAAKMYKDMHYSLQEDDDMDYELKDGALVSQDVLKQSRMPSIKDSNLWILKCKPGEEFHAASILMNKFIASKKSGKSFGIESVVYRHNLPGYIYVECANQGTVKEAIEGISTLKSNLYRDLVTVGLKEMPSVLRIVRGSQMELKEKDFVRIRRGVFKDDLAQIIFVDHSISRVQVKMIPRSVNGMLNSNKQVRPPQKLFDKSTAIQQELFEDEDGYLIYHGQQYTSDGFVIKTFPINSIITSGVEPSLNELKKFETDESLNSKILLRMKQKTFNMGDRVAVISGDLENLEGKIVSVSESTISMLPIHDDLNTPVEFAPSELVKIFDQGDHVRVIAGNHANETGHILNISEGFATILSDMNMRELNVKVDELQLSKEKSSGIDQTGQYQYGDLVLLDEQNVGMIIQIEKECFKILNCQGKLIPINRNEILRKRNKPNAITLDAEHNPVSIKMQVKVINGPMSGQEGHVLSIFRHFIFIKSNSYPENGGILVTRAKNIKIFNSNMDYGAMNNYTSNTLLKSPRRMIQSPNHQKSPSGGKPSVGGSGGRIITSRKNPLIGRSVRITKGPYKTYSGIVKATTDTTARIELTSEYKTINVDLNRIVAVDAPQDVMVPTSVSTYWNTPYGLSGSATLPSQTPRGNLMTPMYDGSKTPRVGSQTPRIGSQTPSHMTPHRIPSSVAEDGFTAPPQSALSGLSSHITDSIPLSSPNLSSINDSPAQPISAGSESLSFAGTDMVSPNIPISPSLSETTYNYMSSIPSSSIETPHTPFVGTSETPTFLSNSLDWISVGLITIIKETFSENAFHGKKAVVRGINGSQISVYVEDLQRTTTLSGFHLMPLVPDGKYQIKVIHGDEKEKLGDLHSIDGNDAIVKIHGSSVTLIPLIYLCSYIES